MDIGPRAGYDPRRIVVTKKLFCFYVFYLRTVDKTEVMIDRLKY